MTGQYKTSNGEIVKVVMFDEPSKTVYVTLPTGQNKWFTESEYSKWESTENRSVEQVKIDAAINNEPPPGELVDIKTKRTYKKKDK